MTAFYQHLYVVCIREWLVILVNIEAVPTVQLLHTATCPELQEPQNGTLSLSNGRAAGSSATYTCDEGFISSGSLSRVCRNTGQWTGTDVICQRKPQHVTIILD